VGDLIQRRWLVPNSPRLTRRTAFAKRIAVVSVRIHGLVMQQCKYGRIGGTRVPIPLLVAVENIDGLHIRRLKG